MDLKCRNNQARKKSLAVSVACMAIYWPTPGFKGRTFKLCVLTRWDFNFSASAAPHCGAFGSKRLKVSLYNSAYPNFWFQNNQLREEMQSISVQPRLHRWIVALPLWKSGNALTFHHQITKHISNSQHTLPYTLTSYHLTPHIITLQHALFIILHHLARHVITLQNSSSPYTTRHRLTKFVIALYHASLPYDTRDHLIPHITRHHHATLVVTLNHTSSTCHTRYHLIPYIVLTNNTRVHLIPHTTCHHLTTVVITLHQPSSSYTTHHHLTTLVVVLNSTSSPSTRHDHFTWHIITLHSDVPSS